MSKSLTTFLLCLMVFPAVSWAQFSKQELNALKYMNILAAPERRPSAGKAKRIYKKAKKVLQSGVDTQIICEQFDNCEARYDADVLGTTIAAGTYLTEDQLFDLVRELVVQGADLNYGPSFRSLVYVQSDSVERFLKLIAFGLYVNKYADFSSYRGEGTQDFKLNSHKSTISFLIEHGRDEILEALADLKLLNGSAKNRHGVTPLHVVFANKDMTQEHNQKLARLILEHGGDMNAKDIDGQVPLDYIWPHLRNDPQVIEFLNSL